jgi:hypothetical protein
MLEGIKRIDNPLTIIAIFAAIADYVSRGTNLSILAMDAISALYLLDDPSLRTAYQLAQQQVV